VYLMKIRHSRVPFPALLAALVAGACDFPTEPPIFESRFVVPHAGTTFSVDDLLPGSVHTVGSSFRVSIAPVSRSRTLEALCGAGCTSPFGFPVPKPAFTDSFVVALVMPVEVFSSTLTSGTVTVAVTHNLGFDVLHPAGRTRDGSLTMRLRSGGRPLGEIIVSGPFPSTTTMTRTVALAPGPLAGDIQMDVLIDSPAGDPVTPNNSGRLGVTLTPVQVDVSEAVVAVQNRHVAPQSMTLDLTRVDDWLGSRVRGGTLILTSHNPWNVAGTMQLQVGGAAVAPRTIQVAPGQTTQRVEFTAAELQSMLGNVLTLLISGPLSAPGGMMTVMPGQLLTIGTVLDLIFAVGA
jgi:hypothetical protein